MKRNPRSNRGFSLVEITLSLGIIAFALIPLLGLLPTGLSMQRKSIEDTTIAQIAQHIVGELQRADFDSLVQTSAGSVQAKQITDVMCFDDQGRYLGTKAKVSDSRSRIYDVKTELAMVGADQTSAVPSYNLVRATLRIALNPGHIDDSAANSPFKNPSTCRTRFALIARTK